MTRIYPILAALVLVVGYGVAEGLWTNRWWKSEEARRAVERLNQVELLTLGEWQGSSRELDALQLQVGEIDGYLMRDYVNRKGVGVSVLIVCGRPGPISVHTPDICYGSQGFALAADPTIQRVDAEELSKPAHFFMGNFVKGGTDPQQLRIYWTWNANGEFAASGNPRWSFSRYSALYKIYVIRPLTRLVDPDEDDPAINFMQLFLPELQKQLFPTP